MIRVLVKKQNKRITGFHIEGHSGYADAGEDIICAAVSALAVNCVNSMEEFTEDDFVLESDEAAGMIDLSMPAEYSRESEILLNSLVFGLRNISDTYGNQYVSVINH